MTSTRVQRQPPGQQDGRDRLALEDVDHQVDAGGHEGLQRVVVDEQPDEEETSDAGDRADDGHVVQQEREGTPEQRVRQAQQPHRRPGEEPHQGVHHRDGGEVAGDVALDLDRDLHRASLILPGGQHLDQPPQQRVAGGEQEETTASSTVNTLPSAAPVPSRIAPPTEPEIGHSRYRGLRRLLRRAVALPEQSGEFLQAVLGEADRGAAGSRASFQASAGCPAPWRSSPRPAPRSPRRCRRPGRTGPGSAPAPTPCAAGAAAAT